MRRYLKHHVKRILLPSGNTIGVVYPSEPSLEAERISSDSVSVASSSGLQVCPECESDLVYPTEWSELGSGRWRVVLRCPNCEWTGSGVFSQQLLDRFAEQLDQSTDTLVRDLKRLARTNMEDEIARFVAALQADAILPADF